jgi:hypothetical protein
MSDDKKPQAQQSRRVGNKEGINKKPWIKRAGQKSEKKDPEEIPVLRFGPNNNFTKFKEALANKAMREYGDLGRLIETGMYYAPEPPDRDDYDFVNDPYGINRATYLEHQKQYMKHWEDMVNQRPKLYALIMQYLSPESIEEVKRQTDYELMKQNKDVQ